MAIQVGGTQVISNSQGLTNITSIDSTTATAIGAAGVGGGGTWSLLQTNTQSSIAGVTNNASNGTIHSYTLTKDYEGIAVMFTSGNLVKTWGSGGQANVALRVSNDSSTIQTANSNIVAPIVWSSSTATYTNLSASASWTSSVTGFNALTGTETQGVSRLSTDTTTDATYGSGSSTYSHNLTDISSGATIYFTCQPFAVSSYNSSYLTLNTITMKIYGKS